MQVNRKEITGKYMMKDCDFRYDIHISYCFFMQDAQPFVSQPSSKGESTPKKRKHDESDDENDEVAEDAESCQSPHRK